MVLIMIWLLLPLAATIIYSLFEDWTGIIPRGFTLANYEKIFTDPAFLTSMYQTVLICVIPISRHSLRVFSLSLVDMIMPVYGTAIRSTATIRLKMSSGTWSERGASVST